jgi:hypothetical protein
MDESFKIIQFGIEDIVRSGLVKEYIIAKEGGISPKLRLAS